LEEPELNDVLLRIEGFDLPGRTCAAGPDFPGYANVHVAVQRKDRPKELLDVTPGDAEAATWQLPCESFVDAEGTLTLRGPYIQNRLGGRFVYLSWGDVGAAGDFQLFRRAKLFLRLVDPGVMAAAAEGGVLTARVRLTDGKGHPACAGMVPPALVWSASGG
jgi:hypothetical protein